LLGRRVNQERILAEQADNDRHVLRFDGRERRIILCVETALELRPGWEGFDPRQLEELLAEATDMMRSSASPIDSIRIIPER
jgi:hypothetical protein